MKHVTITAVRPKVWHRSYSNQSSQGSLVTRTAKWPKPAHRARRAHYEYNVFMEREVVETEEEVDYDATIPDDCDIGSTYIDRVYLEPEWEEFISALNGRGKQQMGISSLFEHAKDETILKAVSILFGAEVIAVQVVYYFNVATGYDCERIDAIYKKREANEEV